MDLRILKDTPPWEWPEEAGEIIIGILRDDHADESERLLAAELAGDFTVINEELVDALLSIVLRGDETEELRCQAVLSLGPALEYAYTDGFDDPEEVPISEGTFRRLQESLRQLYLDTDVTKNVRRRILEASVRAPQDWHPDAVRAAYSLDDELWRLTAVFCMRFIRGFDDQIVEVLESENPEIHYQAVCAAGIWEVDAAWSHVAGLVTSEGTDKPLLLAAIEAVANIRPQEAAEILTDLIDSKDEDIAEAILEALAMAGLPWEDEDWDEDEEDEYLH
jgi:HEAT repeat protein